MRRPSVIARLFNSWGCLDSTGLKGHKLQVEDVRHLVNNRAKQTNANDNVVAGNFGRALRAAA